MKQRSITSEIDTYLLLLIFNVQEISLEMKNKFYVNLISYLTWVLNWKTGEINKKFYPHCLWKLYI